MKKRIFSLFLTLVLCLSTLTVGVSAKTFSDYSDAADVSYAEAVEVLSSIGILDDYEVDENSFEFHPTDSITREATADMIARLANPGVELPVGTGTMFPDVPEGYWSAGVIEYVVSQGIIAGRADGSFDPLGSVTGYEFGKMVLTALGYDAEGASDLFEDLLARSGGSADAPITREQAASLLYAALTGEIVGGTAYDRFDLARFTGPVYADDAGAYLKDVTVLQTNEDGSKTLTTMTETRLDPQTVADNDLAAGDMVRLVTAGEQVAYFGKVADYRGAAKVSEVKESQAEGEEAPRTTVVFTYANGTSDEKEIADGQIDPADVGSWVGVWSDVESSRDVYGPVPEYVDLDVERTRTNTEDGSKWLSGDDAGVFVRGDQAKDIRANRTYTLVTDYDGTVLASKVTGMNIPMLGMIGGVGKPSTPAGDPTLTIEADEGVEFYYGYTNEYLMDGEGSVEYVGEDFDGVPGTNQVRVPVGYMAYVYAETGTVTAVSGLPENAEEEGNGVSFIMPDTDVRLEIKAISG